MSPTSQSTVQTGFTTKNGPKKSLRIETMDIDEPKEAIYRIGNMFNTFSEKSGYTARMPDIPIMSERVEMKK